MAEQLTDFESVIALLRGAGISDIDLLRDALWLAPYYPPRTSQSEPSKPSQPSEQGQKDTGSKETPAGRRPDKPKEAREDGIDTRQPPRPKEEALLFAKGASDRDGTRRASVVYVPASGELPQPLELARAMRPFQQKLRSRHQWILDETATAELSAERRQITPVFRPRAERWFSVSLLLDDAPAMAVWRRTSHELARFLGETGIFRDVRLWKVDSDLNLRTAADRPATPGQLADPSGRTLVLILTNGVGPHWQARELIGWIVGWAKSSPVAFCSLLPKLRWEHTDLGPAYYWARAASPGIANPSLIAGEGPWPVELERGALAFPIFPLSREGLASWAAMQMSRRETRVSALTLAPHWFDERAAAVEEQRQVAASDRVSEFYSIASDEACRLLRYFSAIPLYLPVMRLVQYVMMPSSPLSAMSEVLMSGLIEPKRIGDTEMFDFVPEAREHLRRRTDIVDLDRIRREVMPAIREFIEEHVGAIGNFEAWIEDPEGTKPLDAEALHFVTLMRDLIEKLGYRERERMSSGKRRATQLPESILHDVPDVPEEYIPRPELEERLAGMLIQEDPVETTVWGEAGIGRKTLVARVCRRADVRKAFPGGLFWGDRFDWLEKRGTFLVIRDNASPFKPAAGMSSVLITDLEGAKLVSRPTCHIGPMDSTELTAALRGMNVTEDFQEPIGELSAGVPQLVVWVARAWKEFGSGVLEQLRPSRTMSSGDYRTFLADSMIGAFPDDEKKALRGYSVFQGDDPIPPGLGRAVAGPSIVEALERAQRICLARRNGTLPRLVDACRVLLSEEEAILYDQHITDYYVSHPVVDGYYERWLVFHLCRARLEDRVCDLLVDPQYLAALKRDGLQALSGPSVRVSSLVSVLSGLNWEEGFSYYAFLAALQDETGLRDVAIAKARERREFWPDLAMQFCIAPLADMVPAMFEIGLTDEAVFERILAQDDLAARAPLDVWPVRGLGTLHELASTWETWDRIADSGQSTVEAMKSSGTIPQQATVEGLLESKWRGRRMIAYAMLTMSDAYIERWDLLLLSARREDNRGVERYWAWQAIRHSLRSVADGAGGDDVLLGAISEQLDTPEARSDHELRQVLEFVREQLSGPRLRTERRVLLWCRSGDWGWARGLYRRLQADGANPWMVYADRSSDRRVIFREALSECTMVLVVVRNSPSKEAGTWEEEVRIATELADRKPRGSVFLVPVLLEECELAGSLGRWQSVELYKADGYERLINALRAGGCLVATEQNPADGMHYVWVPPGKFRMGASEGDDEAYDDEKPVHDVEITKGFWIAQTPVTQRAYEKVTGKNPSRAKGPDLPVESVTWEEAAAYCRAVGGRLPTEAEWEYAARAGSTAARYGDLDDIAWYRNNSGGETHPVGQKKGNKLGLYDTLGNVWEWTADRYGPYQAGAQKDPSGAASGDSRVLRGGAWVDGPDDVRVSVRGSVRPGVRVDRFGFRCLWERPFP